MYESQLNNSILQRDMMNYNKRDTIDEDDDEEDGAIGKTDLEIEAKFSKRNTYQEGIKFLR